MFNKLRNKKMLMVLKTTLKRVWSRYSNAIVSTLCYMIVSYFSHLTPVYDVMSVVWVPFPDFNMVVYVVDMVISLSAGFMYLTLNYYKPNQLHLHLTEADFVSAMERGDMEVVIQPVYDLHTNSVTGFESLLRLHHPEYGIITPHQFSSITGNAVTGTANSAISRKITKYVLDKTADYYKLFKQDGYNMQMSVNLFACDMSNASLINTISSVLTTHDMPADMLMVEVAEQALVYNTDVSFKIVAGLETMGVKLTLDDYSPSMTSPMYFNGTAADGVKLDKDLTSKLLSGGANTEFVQAAIYGVHSQGASVTAKCIDSKQMMAALRSAGCDYVQGYVIAPPMTYYQAKGWLRTQRVAKPRYTPK